MTDEDGGEHILGCGRNILPETREVRIDLGKDVKSSLVETESSGEAGREMWKCPSGLHTLSWGAALTLTFTLKFCQGDGLQKEKNSFLSTHILSQLPGYCTSQPWP